MSTARESFFLCTFTSRSRRIARQVRAWSEEQAALQFSESLAEEGVTARGRIHVTAMSGRLDDGQVFEREVAA